MNLVMSEDQKEAMEAILDLVERGNGAVAVTGYAGSGKTFILEKAFKEIINRHDVNIVGEKNGFRTKDDKFNIAAVSPTNKAAMVLNKRGVPACTIHQVIYTPIFHEFYETLEKIETFCKNGEYDQADQMELATGKIDTTGGAIDITEEFCDSVRDLLRKGHSVSNVLSRFGYKPLDFIICWKVRDTGNIDLIMVDESSMITMNTRFDIERAAKAVVFFGDPGQLPPVTPDRRESRMIFADFPDDLTCHLDTIHRQKDGSPIIELATCLRENISFDDFQKKVEELSRKYPESIYISQHPYADLMLYSPYLVWRNRTRVTMNMMFRRKFGISEDDYLKTGEPIICEGIISSRTDVRFKSDMSGRGFFRGTNCWYAGGGYSGNLGHVLIDGQTEVHKNVPLIYERETLDEKRIVSEWIPSSGKGVLFKYGAAITIHKSQGSQWNTVQFSGTDLFVANRMGKTDEDGVPLWRRLAYVAVTRASDSVVFVINDDDIHPPTFELGEWVIESNANRHASSEPVSEEVDASETCMETA